MARLTRPRGVNPGHRRRWLGRSATTDWTIEGGHFAERCQAFILIALGESIVVPWRSRRSLLQFVPLSLQRALSRVDVWILITTIACVVIAYLTLVKSR